MIPAHHAHRFQTTVIRLPVRDLRLGAGFIVKPGEAKALMALPSPQPLSHDVGEGLQSRMPPLARYSGRGAGGEGCVIRAYRNGRDQNNRATYRDS
jgi:hypothetical protein